MAIIVLCSQSFAFANVGQLAAQKNAKTKSSPDVSKLEVGMPIEREMKGSESHTYEITLEAGHFLNAVVEQRGIHVVVQVIDPDGKQLMAVDSPNGDKGDEPVTLITEVAGIYRLKVDSPEKNAPFGKYEILVKELRVATEKDRALQEAIKLNQEVERFYGGGANMMLHCRLLNVLWQFEKRR